MAEESATNTELGTEEPIDPGFEIEVGEAPPLTQPEVITMTPDEFAALKAQSDSAAAIKAGIEGLSSKLGSSVAPPAAPAVNTPAQSPEEYFAEHADDMFDKDKGAKVLAEYNRRVMERDYGPMLTSLSSNLASARKELLAGRDPIFKKYENEVVALVRAQPPNVQIMPDIYERAWAQVRQAHAAEIEEENVNAKVNAAVEAKLKELGIDPTKPNAGTTRPPAYVNSEGRSAPSASPAGKRTVRLPNEETRQKLEREALRRGIDLNDLLRLKGYVE